MPFPLAIRWRSVARILTAFAATYVVGSSAVRGYEGDRGRSSVDVTVKCETLASRSGATLSVLRQSPSGGVPWRMPQTPAFDATGQCTVSLPPGRYQFEVLFLDQPTTLVALRTSPQMIRRSGTVDIEASEPQPIDFATLGQAKGPIRELAIRSVGPTGELCWKSPGHGSDSLRVITSPGHRYRVRALGGHEERYFAIWQEMPATEWRLQTDARNLYRCRVQPRDDGPRMEEARVLFCFPDSTTEFAVTRETLFLTNRRFVSFAYWFQMDHGRKVVLRPRVGELARNQRFTIGGPLTPYAWANVMVRKPVGKPETKHLIWGADLCDSQGYLVETDQSNIDWKASARTVWGGEAPKKELTPQQVKALGNLSQTLRITVSYRLQEPLSGVLAPVGFGKYDVGKFDTSAPPHWHLQVLNYLAQVQRVYHLIEEIEAKPAGHAITVRWHGLRGTAWAAGSRPRKKCWIMMPFYGLEGNFDHFGCPWALAHETLHTFGYGHGDRMSRATKMVQDRLKLFRWYVADHPAQDLDTAFAGFRLALRNSHPEAIASHAQDERKGR